MATIPTYDNFQTGKASLPNAQLQAPRYENSSAKQAQAQGQAAQSLGQGISAIATDMQQEANATRIKEAEKDLVIFEHSAEYGDHGYLTLQGKNALDRPDGQSLNEEVGQSYQKHVDSIMKGLGNDAQKAMFKDIAMQRSASFLGGVDRHVMTEHKKYQLDVAHSTITVGQNQMTLAWGDPAKLQEAKGAILGSLDDAARLQGWSKERKQAEQVQALSPAHSSVIMSAIDAGKLDFATAYLEQNKEDMTAGARIQAEHTLKIQGELQQAQASVDHLYTMDTNPEDKMSLARNIEDAKLRKNTITGLKARFSEDDYLQRRRYEQARDTAYQILAQGKQIPASVFGELDGKTKLAFEKMQQQGSRRTQNDPKAYYALRNMSPDKFAAIDLGHYVDVLKPATWEAMVKEQAKMRSGDFSFTSNISKINTAIEALGIKKEDKGKFYERADEWAHALGHKPTDEELKTWVNTMQEEVMTDNGYFFNSNEKIGNIHVDGVPDSEIADIVQALRARGQEASSENISKLYEGIQ